MPSQLFWLSSGFFRNRQTLVILSATSSLLNWLWVVSLFLLFSFQGSVLFVAHTVSVSAHLVYQVCFILSSTFLRTFSVISDRLFSNPIFYFRHLFDDAWISYQISLSLSSTFLSTFFWFFQFLLKNRLFSSFRYSVFFCSLASAWLFYQVSFHLSTTFFNFFHFFVIFLFSPHFLPKLRPASSCQFPVLSGFHRIPLCLFTPLLPFHCPSLPEKQRAFLPVLLYRSFPVDTPLPSP